MTLDEFAIFIHHKNIEKEMHIFFDEHLALYNLLSSSFTNDDIDIYCIEDKNGCHYLLKPLNNSDISKIVIYNKIPINFYAHEYITNVKLNKNNTANIRFVDKKV